MKISLNWLKSFIKIDKLPEEIETIESKQFMNFNKEFLDNIINVTSNAAIACYQHLGKKDKILVDKAATDIMRKNLND